MPKDHSEEFLAFSLDQRHHVTIRGVEVTYAFTSNNVANFRLASDPSRLLAYEISELNRMHRTGEFRVIPYGALPEHLRPAPVRDEEDVFIAGLSPAQRTRVAARYAMVRGFLDLKDAEAIKGDDRAIRVGMDAIRTAAEPYFMEGMPDPEYGLQLQNWMDGKGKKPRTPVETRRPGACSPRSLRKWVSLYRKGGKAALIDRCVKQGSFRSPFNADEVSLLAEVVRTEFLTLQRKPITRVVEDVKLRFNKENEEREAKGKPKLRVPGRDAVRGFIKRLDVFTTLVARHGVEIAMRKMQAVKAGLQVSRPLERVEMDEQLIDLISILAKGGLFALFSEEELKVLGLLNKSMRWWLVLAIDCRTRCILGMTLTCNPRSSAALKCLRMVVSDKGQFADSVGTLAPWSMFGKPEMLVTDNGAAFKSLAFTAACADLGIHDLQAIGGAPNMRGVGERVFGTLSSGLMSRLSGRTFSNVLERQDHDSGKRACLTIEDLTVALVRWAVDIYHNTPHAGLGGRTPLQQWDADIQNNNLPLHSAPSARRRHIALGVALARVLQKDGLRIMNVRYNSQELAEFFLRNGKRTLEIRWNEEDLGSIEVLLDGAWRSVPSSLDTFRGVHASTWLRACRSLRATDPKRKDWEEHVVGTAIRDIEAMNAGAKRAMQILDHAWTEKRLQEIESDALMAFGTVSDRPKTADAPDRRGRIILPVEPADHAPDARRVNPDRHQIAHETACEGEEELPEATGVYGETPVVAPEPPVETAGSSATERGDRFDEDGGGSGGWDFDLPA